MLHTCASGKVTKDGQESENGSQVQATTFTGFSLGKARQGRVKMRTGKFESFHRALSCGGGLWSWLWNE